jgi:hypothetical protein
VIETKEIYVEHQKSKMFQNPKLFEHQYYAPKAVDFGFSD